MARPRVGVDILALRRMHDAIETTGQTFLDRVFTRAEQEAARRHPDRIAFLATRFAVKEAVFKTLGVDRTGIELTDIEVMEGAHGEPEIVAHGHVADILTAARARLSISVAYDDATAIAVALLSGEEAIS